MTRLLNIIHMSLLWLALSVIAAFASDCASDPNECTPKDLCEVATEVTDGNKLWSSAATSSKHVSFAQELSMNCGVVELKDPCDTDPNQCKINQLCEKATIEDGGTKSWNSEAEAWTAVAQEYGLECGVTVEDSALTNLNSNEELCSAATTITNGRISWEQWINQESVKKAKELGLTCGVGELSSSTKAVQSTGGEVSCTLKSLQGCSEDYICTRATYLNSRDQNRQWAYGLYTDEANRRGLTCGVIEENSTETDSPLKNYDDSYVCEKATYDITGKGKKWSALSENRVFVEEAEKRGLTCDVVAQCSNSNIKLCTNKQICDKATFIKLELGQKYRAWWSDLNFVTEAKNRGLSCNVIKYDLKRYYTWEVTKKGYEGDISITDASRTKGTDAFYSWASTGEARFWTDYDPDKSYYSNAYTNTVFPNLTSAFNQKTKSDRQRIQRNLKNKGLYDSTIDGLWGRNTLVALTDYSSKRLRTIRLTDPQIVQTLMDQIMSDTSSGVVGLASSEVINEIYAHLENIQKNEENSYAFESVFKSKSTLERKQIQYALKYLGYYNSGIDGLWGNGTRKALASFTESNNLTTTAAWSVLKRLLSLVDVPSSFNAPQQSTSSSSSSSNSNSNSSKTYYKGMRPLMSNPSTSAEQAWAICSPQAHLAGQQARRSVRPSSSSIDCDIIGRSVFCDKSGGGGGFWGGMNQALDESMAYNGAKKAVMASCLAQYGWKE